jgi:hypothetical protein
MGDVYDLVNTTENKFPQPRLVLSGVHRRRDLSLRSIGALNTIYDLIAKTFGVTFVNTFGVTFVNPNSRIDNWDR